mmetsp:Transcript_4947/g.9315  ORF Transcript_4947/g.9315 Transcript_4947/m.9315 type:complete len:732 (-) Transcript_4947:60-2255(-)
MKLPRAKTKAKTKAKAKTNAKTNTTNAKIKAEKAQTTEDDSSPKPLKKPRVPYFNHKRIMQKPPVVQPLSPTIAPITSTVIVPTGSKDPRRNIRGVLQLRIMLKKEMVAAGTFTSEEELAARVREEWTRLGRGRKTDLRRLARASYQFHSSVPNAESNKPAKPVPVRCSSENDTTISSCGNSGRNSSGSRSIDQLLDPVVPLIFNRHILSGNSNRYAILWDRIAAYQLVKAFTPAPSQEDPSTSSNSCTQTIAYSHSHTQQDIDKLAEFANFANDDEWRAAVVECQDAPVAKGSNPFQNLFQPLGNASTLPRLGSIASLDVLDKQVAAGMSGTTRNIMNRQDMQKVALKVTKVRNKNKLHGAEVVSQSDMSELGSQSPLSHETTQLGQSDATLSYDKQSQSRSEELGVSDSEGEGNAEDPEAYVSDDDQLRELLNEEELSASDDDDDRVRQQEQNKQDENRQGQGAANKGFMMKSASGLEFDDQVKYRYIMESENLPGKFHVFIPLPTFRYVRTLKRPHPLDRGEGEGEVDTGDDHSLIRKPSYYYVKKRNVERLMEVFDSRQDAMVAYDACVRRLYGYGGFSFSTKKASNEWHYSSDQISAKRCLRVFSHTQKQHQHQLAAFNEVSDHLDPRGEGSTTAKIQPARTRSVQVELAPKPSELDNAYRSYIENSLRQMGKMQDLTSFSAWQRRNLLFDDATTEAKRQKRLDAEAPEVVKKQEPDLESESSLFK